MSLILHETFGAGQYDIGTGSVGHSNPNVIQTVNHASGQIYAAGLTFFIVRPDVPHVTATANFTVDGTTYTRTSSPTFGASDFFGFISDTPLTSFTMTSITNGGVMIVVT